MKYLLGAKLEMSKKVIKLPAFNLPFLNDAKNKKQLNDMFMTVVNSGGVSPTIFKIPILATLAWAMKEPLPGKPGKKPVPSDNVNDYVPAIMALLDKFNLLKPMLSQLALFKQAEKQLAEATARQLAEEEAAKETEPSSETEDPKKVSKKTAKAKK